MPGVGNGAVREDEEGGGGGGGCIACGIRSLSLTMRPLVCVPLESTRDDEEGDDDADDEDDAILLPFVARFAVLDVGTIVVVVRARLLRLLALSTF